MKKNCNNVSLEIIMKKFHVYVHAENSRVPPWVLASRAIIVDYNDVSQNSHCLLYIPRKPMVHKHPGFYKHVGFLKLVRAFFFLFKISITNYVIFYLL